MLLIDIETAPLNPDPFPFEPEAFDTTAVKVGNLKDPDKIKAKIAAAELDHNRSKLVDAEKWLEKATLDPSRGWIQAIGVFDRQADTYREFLAPTQEDEAGILRQFAAISWAVEGTLHNRRELCAWNGFRFDFPWIHRRCILNGIHSPMRAPIYRNGWLADMMLDCTLGFQAEYHGIPGAWKLAKAAISFGLDAKHETGETVTPSGRTRKKLPHEVYRDDPEKFSDYLRRDVEIMAEIAQKLY